MWRSFFQFWVQREWESNVWPDFGTTDLIMFTVYISIYDFEMVLEWPRWNANLFMMPLWFSWCLYDSVPSPKLSYTEQKTIGKPSCFCFEHVLAFVWWRSKTLHDWLRILYIMITRLFVLWSYIVYKIIVWFILYVLVCSRLRILFILWSYYHLVI